MEEALPPPVHWGALTSAMEEDASQKRRIEKSRPHKLEVEGESKPGGDHDEGSARNLMSKITSRCVPCPLSHFLTARRPPLRGSRICVRHPSP